MLDNPHQLAAYKLLQATPVHTAAAINLTSDIATAGTAKAAALTALHKTTVTYPTSIASHVTNLTNWVALANRAKTVADAFKSTITPYQDPEQMIQLYTGWQVHLKVNNLPENSPIRTNNAVGDTTIVTAVKAAITGLDLTALTTAWTNINTALATPPASTGTTPTPTPALSQAQIDALSTAMTTATPTFDALKNKIDAMETLTNNAKTDADLATSAFGRAVTVAILTNITSNEVLTDSLKAIIPANVYIELVNANKNI